MESLNTVAENSKKKPNLDAHSMNVKQTQDNRNNEQSWEGLALKGIGHYQCTRWLCEGSYGQQVFRAQKPDDHKKYTIKFIPVDQDASKTDKKSILTNEFKMMQSFNHVNILRTHELIETDNYNA